MPVQRNEKGRFVTKSPVDVREDKDIPKLQTLIHEGPITFVLIYADWCGHCMRFKPTWAKYANTPGRRANIASVHHDMVDKIPEIKEANIEGYPSVVQVKSNGEIAEYTVPGTEAKTNAIPFMRDEEKMKEALKSIQPTVKPASNVATPGVQAGIKNTFDSLEREQTLTKQSGGSVLGAIVQALQRVGPSAILLAGYSMLPKPNSKTFKSPKRSNRRAHTRKNRRV